VSAASITLADYISYDATTLRVRSHESTQREFKQTYEATKVPRYLKTLAAFANNHGGALFFGISDSPRTILGVNEVDMPDPADWQNRLRSHFEPAILTDVHVFEAAGRTVVAITVPQSAFRPVICSKAAGETFQKGGKTVQQPVLQQGAIYFRYAGSNEPIRFAELSEILRDRDDRRLKAFLQNVRMMHRLGVETVGVVDLGVGQGLADGAQVYLSEEAARKLNVIDRGRFVESDQEGERAFVVAGTIHLNKVIKEPLGEEDKNLPEEAATHIRPELQRIYGKELEFKGMHLAKAAAWLGIWAGKTCDPRYVIEEKKVGRVYYTRAGMGFVVQEIAKRPLEAIRNFGSKPAIAAYQATLMAASPV
jgi:hypothetical protein